jgi:hypothetical protein
MTQLLRKKYLITGVSDLSTISKVEIRQAFNESAIKSEVNFDEFYKKINTFFQSIKI